MSVTRFRLALEQTSGGHWQPFERLAQVFLGSQFVDLRPMATQSGDQGRDAELYAPDGLPQVLLQFSTARDWRSKVGATLKRVSDAFPTCKVLVYATNQEIGANADLIRNASLADYSIFLDVRDREWFALRYSLDSSLEKAADEYARSLVDPFLEERGLIRSRPAALTGEETQAAIVYLELQWEDDTREKGLTKLSFEALVRSVLRETDSEHRLPRKQVLERVRRILPSHATEHVDSFTEAALIRLNKRAIRHWVKEDEFCLANEERERLSERLSTTQYNASRFLHEIRERFEQCQEGKEATDNQIEYEGLSL